MTNPDSNVAFIVSQPRSGSTLLQAILDSHPEVVSTGEAWMMLPLAYALRGNSPGVRTPYDAELAQEAVSSFAHEFLEHGLSDLQRHVGNLAADVYQGIANRAGARLVLDKTPRYYLIVDDLLQLLPDSRIIVLVRNPLAVLASIHTTWIRHRLGNLHIYREDLLEGPARLANAIAYQQPRIAVVRYEQLVASPEPTLEALQSFLGLQVHSGLHHYAAPTRRRFGDPTGVHQFTMPTVQSCDKWLDTAKENPVIWRLLRDYLDVLGEDLLARLGYDWQILHDQLKSVQPAGTWLAPPLQTQLKERPPQPRRAILKMRNSWATSVSKWRSASSQKMHEQKIA